MTTSDDIDTTETRAANAIIEWLVQAQASGKFAFLQGLPQSKIVRVAWNFLRSGVQDRAGFDAYLEMQATRAAEIDRAWAAHHAKQKTDPVHNAFLQHFKKNEPK